MSVSVLRSVPVPGSGCISVPGSGRVFVLGTGPDSGRVFVLGSGLRACFRSRVRTPGVFSFSGPDSGRVFVLGSGRIFVLVFGVSLSATTASRLCPLSRIVSGGRTLTASGWSPPGLGPLADYVRLDTSYLFHSRYCPG